MDQYKTPELSRRAVQVILAGGEFGRPLVATPGTPPERLNILREAFAKSMKDPELLAEAKKSKMDVDPSTAEELEALIKEAMSQPKEVNEPGKETFWEINQRDLYGRCVSHALQGIVPLQHRLSSVLA